MRIAKKSERNYKTWIKQFHGSGLKIYSYAWNFWLKFHKVSDTDTLEKEIKASLQTQDWGTLLLDYRRFLSKQDKVKGRGKFSDNTTRVYTTAIRSYLRHVGAVLDLTPHQKEQLIKIESRPTMDFLMNLNVKEALMKVANPLEDYILCAGISFGLRVGDFVKITRGMLEPLLTQDPPIQLSPIITKKEGIYAHPLIDRDAKESITNYLKEMDIEGRTDSNEPMLKFSGTTIKGLEREVSIILNKLFEKAKIPLGEYRVRFHILRKFLTDRLSNLCSNDKWKSFVGKKTTSPYVSAEGKIAYTQVMQYTCVNHKNIARPQEIQKIEKTLSHQKDLIVKLARTVKGLKVQLDHYQSIYFHLDEKAFETALKKARKEFLSREKARNT